VAKLRVNVRRACNTIVNAYYNDKFILVNYINEYPGHFKILNLISKKDKSTCKYSFDNKGLHAGCPINKCKHKTKEIDIPDELFNKFLFYYLKENDR
jgi:hypothetical protein